MKSSLPLILCTLVAFELKVLNALPAQKFDLSKIVTLPDEDSGRALKNWMKYKVGNPEEQGNYFEGDIILNLDQRNGVRLPTQRWENGIIPYKISKSFTIKQKNVISDAIDEIQSKTCIKLRPRAGEKDYVSFENDNSGCWSPVGKIGREQTINLQNACLLRVGTVIHEILHAIGFYHEQSRSDRDQYVKIMNENIASDKLANFVKLNSDEDETFNISYDYESVLHYSPNAFSQNGLPTIVSLKPGKTELMGQRLGLSEKDVQKIKKMYCKN